MDNTHAKVALITGARTGIGNACARLLAAEGHRVYGTSRTPSAVEESDPGFNLIAMDVNDTESVNQGVETILTEAGRLDVVVNNAGFGYGGAVEDSSVEETKALFETNVFGPLRVCRAVLPHMRGRGEGLIVNVSSIGGLMGLPFQGLYSASKFAVEGLTASLRMEVKPFGIQVVLLEPGDIRTSFTANRRPTLATRARGAYREPYAKALGRIEADEQGGPDPEVVGRALVRIANKRVPKPRYIVGPFYERVAVWASHALPGALFEWLIMKYYGL
jgi:NAD(P)-dependent dehydrogenase (short-subunit alcohol dehydrogenase family)